MAHGWGVPVTWRCIAVNIGGLQRHETDSWLLMCGYSSKKSANSLRTDKLVCVCMQ